MKKLFASIEIWANLIIDMCILVSDPNFILLLLMLQIDWTAPLPPFPTLRNFHNYHDNMDYFFP